MWYRVSDIYLRDSCRVSDDDDKKDCYEKKSHDENSKMSSIFSQKLFQCQRRHELTSETWKTEQVHGTTIKKHFVVEKDCGVKRELHQLTFREKQLLRILRMRLDTIRNLTKQRTLASAWWRVIKKCHISICQNDKGMFTKYVILFSETSNTSPTSPIVLFII